jgi:DNA-binding response OmpR family regulator
VIALLLEDEPLIAMDLELTLESAGFEVHTMVSCKEAHAWLDAWTPDVVIVDIELQDGSSESVVRRLTDNKVPFIVHSGDLPSLHSDTPFAAGRWVNKPSLTGELVDAARELLE